MAEKQERQYAPDEVNEHGEYIKIGGSPVPGITLVQILQGHKGTIKRMAWSPDGQYLASPSEDETIRIWDTDQGKCVKVLSGHRNYVYSVGWSPVEGTLASASSTARDASIIIWNMRTGEPLLKIPADLSQPSKIVWSPDGHAIATAEAAGSMDVEIWDVKTGKLIVRLPNTGQVNDLIWSRDGKKLYSCSVDQNIRIWDANSGVLLQTLKNNSGAVTSIALSSKENYLVSGNWYETIQIWDLSKAKMIHTLEGHTGHIGDLSLSFSDQLLASNSGDNSIHIWRTDNWEPVAKFVETYQSWTNLVFHPKRLWLATTGHNGTIIRIWAIDYDTIVGNQPRSESIHYTTAKLVLVGDSGVGKTGLGWRLAGNEFKEHSSTHGQQFWVIPELGLKRKDGTECEAVLWDLAGQPDYRLVHSLYLDDVDTALILFDPTNRQEPLSGVDFWLNQLKDKDRKLHNTILVGARTDRGTSTLTETEIQAYCERNRISGGYVSTSALKGDGLPELLEKLKAQIPWDEMTTTVTTVTFKKIKEFVLSLKEKTERKNVLVQPLELRQQLQATDKDREFSDAEMMTAVGHLETHGYVKIIHSSNGQHSILLAPDLLANLASSIVLEARRNPRGLGVLEEERLLHGEYPFPELVNLSEEESKILLDAATVLFLEHNLCFRETFNNQTFLVFPSLINEKRPVDESIKIEEGASYRVKGAVENVYASLVVLLGYTNTFTRTHQWQNQAQYEMGEGEICGFIQSEYRNGEIELVLYYGENTPDPVRLTFRGLFERFLTRRELEIARYQPVICHKCGSPLARNVVMDQLGKGKDHSFCHECGEKLQLPSPEPVSRLSRREEVLIDVQQAVAQRRTAFEAALVRVKGLLRDQGKEKVPTCFISYSWGVPEHERWVVQFAKDLRNAGIDVLLDKWYVIPGANLDRYIERIMITDYVAVVGTPKLRQKYDSTSSDPVVTAELEMVNLRVRQPKQFGHTILPILLDGDASTAFAPQLQKLVYVDFRQSAYYFRQLFDMIWRLYDLPFDNPLLEELQASMTPQERP